MKAYLVLRIILLALIPEMAAGAQNVWRPYKVAVRQTLVEVALPYDRLNELTRRDWQVPYRAVRLEWIDSGRGTQREVFNALLDIYGPFWVGVYGRIHFFAFVNKKPDWFTRDLFEISSLKEMMEYRVGVLGKATDFRFDILTINGVRWVHWFDYDSAAPSAARTSRMDRYTRPLTDDLYLDVAIDRLKSSTSDKLDWLKEADLIHDQLRKSLVIRYPSKSQEPNK